MGSLDPALALENRGPPRAVVGRRARDLLWAPWRLAYVAQAQPRGCLFCRKRRARRDARELVVLRGRRAFVMLNRYPYNNGHLMIAPYRHVGTLEALTSEEWQEIGRLLVQFQRRLTRLLHPHGFNIGLNLGRPAGAGVPGHLHAHLVPRWNGDTNFMPVIAKTKVISQSLDELYRQLRHG